MDGWLVETAACCRARLAKKEGEHRGSGSLSPSSGDLGRGRWPRDLTQRSAQRLVGCIHFPAGHTLEITQAEEENSCCTISSLFTHRSTRSDGLPCSRGAENIPGAGSTRMFKRFCSFTGSQSAITLTHTSFPFLWLSCFLFLIVSHSHPSFPPLFL